MKVRKFTDAKLAVLESKGIKLTESQYFTSTYYRPDKDGITIYTEKCGDLQINWTSIDDFIKELQKLKEVYGQ